MMPLKWLFQVEIKVIVEKKQLFVLFFQILVDNAKKHGYYEPIVTEK